MAKPKAPTSLADIRRERQARQIERSKLEAHNERVAASNEASTLRRVRGVKLASRVNVDPSTVPQLKARRMPDASPSGHCGMPADAPASCPNCGASLPRYFGQGRYDCAMNRLAIKWFGCGARWIGPAHASESPLDASTAAEWPHVPQYTDTSESSSPGELDDVFS
jgi:hypothetical protein